MVTVNDIYMKLCQYAPLELQMGFDNSGFQLGRKGNAVKKVLLSLDVTGEVAEEAVQLGAELIISHHPLIFVPLKSVSDEKLLKLIENNIAVISMHTNLDIAEGGVNDILAEALGAKIEAPLDDEGCGRIAVLEKEMSFEEFASHCKSVLKTAGLRYYNSGRRIKRIALMGGAGGDELYKAAAANCDVYLTADIKYHQFLDAKELGISLIDGDHFCTENLVIPSLAERLSADFSEIEFVISKCHGQVISFA